MSHTASGTAWHEEYLNVVACDGGACRRRRRAVRAGASHFRGVAGEDRAGHQGESRGLQGRHHHRRVSERAEGRAGVRQGVREPQGLLRADAGARREGAVRDEFHDRTHRRMDEAHRQAGHGEVGWAADRGDVVSAFLFIELL